MGSQPQPKGLQLSDWMTIEKESALRPNEEKFFCGVQSRYALLDKALERLYRSVCLPLNGSAYLTPEL